MFTLNSHLLSPRTLLGLPLSLNSIYISSLGCFKNDHGQKDLSACPGAEKGFQAVARAKPIYILTSSVCGENSTTSKYV